MKYMKKTKFFSLIEGANASENFNVAESDRMKRKGVQNHLRNDVAFICSSVALQNEGWCTQWGLLLSIAWVCAPQRP